MSPRREVVYTNRRELRHQRSGRRLQEVTVRKRLLLAATAALSLALVATTASARPTAGEQADSITVWLMGDAQANWPTAVSAANSAFRAKHPGVAVNVEYQSWGDYKTKFEATLTSGGPDVIEFGNTDVPKFNAANAKLMAKFGKNKNYSAVYFPGRYWYAAMSFVHDFGGQIAVRQGGKWVGTLNSPRSLSGLTAWRNVARSYSRANVSGDEAHPQQALVFAKGNVGSFIGNGWEWPYALDKKLGNPKLADKIGAYPMPSHIKGRYMPTFLGGSNLAVPVTSENKTLAADWISAYTSTAKMTRMARLGGVLPNTTSLAKINAAKPTLAPFAEAAKYSWFVPSTPNWANVESANVLQTMLVGILRNPKQQTQLATAASKRISEILNAG